ncbi:MAG: U32 family peptidase [Clostridia bacterium]|nr:U32 family peptidase [Clostridia bacterium]
MELLAPAGDKNKLIMAIHYGADAVYLASKRFGLRTFAGNFDMDELKWAVEYVHSFGKKIYITINIIPHDSDFEGLDEYVKKLDELGVDAVIVADLGVMQVVKAVAPNLDIHISTQANVTNSQTAMAYVNMGAKRIILAREMSLTEIKSLREKLPKDVEIEAFGHGAMCISYSGRCLLSNFMTGRDANRGACVQACRWQYEINEVNKTDKYPIIEDEKGTYILNSQDMCMIKYLDQLKDAGVSSLKIEGRMKSEYYVANIVNAYRQALDYLEKHKKYDLPDKIFSEVFKSSHRQYGTGFFFGEAKQNLETSMPEADYDFVAIVTDEDKKGYAWVEMRNRFKKGESLEVLSRKDNNKIVKILEITNENGESLEDCKIVQQKVRIKTSKNLEKYDILRRKKDAK